MRIEFNTRFLSRASRYSSDQQAATEDAWMLMLCEQHQHQQQQQQQQQQEHGDESTTSLSSTVDVTRIIASSAKRPSSSTTSRRQRSTVRFAENLETNMHYYNRDNDKNGNDKNNKNKNKNNDLSSSLWYSSEELSQMRQEEWGQNAPALLASSHGRWCQRIVARVYQDCCTVTASATTRTTLSPVLRQKLVQVLQQQVTTGETTPLGLERLLVGPTIWHEKETNRARVLFQYKQQQEHFQLCRCSSRVGMTSRSDAAQWFAHELAMALAVSLLLENEDDDEDDDNEDEDDTIDADDEP
ncbi:hypothetical protein ACA910_013756 [Epithemia clementina (nom. ined.)]